MFRQIEGLPRGVFGIEAVGRIMRDEVDEVMITFEATVAEGYDVALLVEYHADMVEDREVDEIRFVNRLSARGRTAFDDFARFIGCNARMFLPGRRDTALTWLLEAPFLKGEGDAG